ncbi:uncharacterized protein PITG_19046 [Phytophthora infestans T30-4]|uniref:Uncharacterized protein n=1 Tax=Phytophthora infestans (strain T30-4) TaxID=403677 RepID=D0NZU9_PHYIT|nr:uncharacterized protein PITG_19046 [Phytophthora infestans T30-4]EEY69664.1 hypothetical protein PITG_19046 [Phytophthora infestans T30-4]|eukprot:XP_002997116.1 hypothetical protein PITG_19046 [Phytophthora infestans T30-4]
MSQSRQAMSRVDTRVLHAGDDALQHLVRNINCDKQQKRIERLREELEKANFRREEFNFGVHVPSSIMVDMPSDVVASAQMNQYHDTCRREIIAPDSAAEENRHSAAVTKAAIKCIILKPLDGAHQFSDKDASPGKSARPAINAPAAPLTQPAVYPTAPGSIYNPKCAVSCYPQIYARPAAPINPYRFSSPPVMPVCPYGNGAPLSYLPGSPYPAAPPWLPSYPYQIGSISPLEQPSNPLLSQLQEDIRRLEQDLEVQRIADEQHAEAKEFVVNPGRKTNQHSTKREPPRWNL